MSESALQGKNILKRANAAFANRQFDLAIAQYTQACHLLPDNIEPLLSLAKAFQQVHSQVDALTVLEYAVQRFPNDAQACYQLAQFYLEIGKVKEATEKLQLITEKNNLDTLTAYAWLDFVRLNGAALSITTFDHTVQQLSAALSRPPLSDKRSMVLHYALGQLFDAKRDYENAQMHLIKANQLQLSACDFSTADMQGFFTSIKQSFTQQRLSEAGQSHNADEQKYTPIFILGLPRTGSTLLEQMLTQHTKINSIGEQTYISNKLASFIQSKTHTEFPVFAGMLEQEIVQQAAQLYWQCVSSHQVDSKFVINKLPANFQSIGFIKMIFPHAKIIEMRRNNRDVALSIFKNYFAENEPYFCNLTEFNQYSNLYEALMTHWKTCLPEQICSVDYAALVKSPEQTLKRVIKYCGLEWQSACLTDYKRGKTVKTLSAAQVRKSLSTASIDAWQNYPKLFSYSE